MGTMTRASKPCGTPGCPNLQPCPEHTRKSWATHTGRHGRMRSGSREQRLNRAVMLRDEGRCHICGEYGADEVDHVIPLKPAARLPRDRDLPLHFIDSMDNRKPAHAKPCHAEKSAMEAARARHH